MRWVLWINRLSQRAGQVAMALVPLLVLVGAWNVVGRYVGRAVGRNLSSNAFLELQWYLFSAIFLLGAAYTLHHNGHVRVDVLYNRWSERRRAWIDLWGTLLFLLPFAALLLWVTVPPVMASWQMGEQSPDPGGLPRYWVKTLPLIGFGLLLLQGMAQAVQLGHFLRRRSPSD
ncbi:MAG: TRAP transporter small permease subunit [Gloeomargarita sp. SKYG116]|nr:TRAP transporter small permease subunit [Gloeomargarita sp. SKYG116]MDW8402058.1 TRAP transporter small permease subunit [Gloeomargarita sp. SKYGB_i_bin116]